MDYKTFANKYKIYFFILSVIILLFIETKVLGVKMHGAISNSDFFRNVLIYSLLPFIIISFCIFIIFKFVRITFNKILLTIFILILLIPTEIIIKPSPYFDVMPKVCPPGGCKEDWFKYNPIGYFLIKDIIEWFPVLLSGIIYGIVSKPHLLYSINDSLLGISYDLRYLLIFYIISLIFSLIIIKIISESSIPSKKK